MSLVFDKSSVAKEYKKQIDALQKEKDATAKKLGEVIIERDWPKGCSKAKSRNKKGVRHFFVSKKP